MISAEVVDWYDEHSNPLVGYSSYAFVRSGL